MFQKKALKLNFYEMLQYKEYYCLQMYLNNNNLIRNNLSLIPILQTYHIKLKHKKELNLTNNYTQFL